MQYDLTKKATEERCIFHRPVTAVSVASNNNMQQISTFVNTYLDFLRKKGFPCLAPFAALTIGWGDGVLEECGNGEASRGQINACGECFSDWPECH
jgi:hypothetical protein